MIRDGKVYQGDLLCVPSGKVERLVRLSHAWAGHPGGERLWAQLVRRYAFPDMKLAKSITLHVQSRCEVCQVTEPSKEP